MRAAAVVWLYGPDADAWPGTSEVEVRLAPGSTGDTEFELIHAAVVDPHYFPTYGPGAGGDPQQVRAAVKATTDFYAPDLAQ